MPATVFLVLLNTFMFLKKILPFILLAGFLTISCNSLSDFDEESVNQALADSLLGLTKGTGVSIRLMVDGNLKIMATGPKSRSSDSSGGSVTRLIGPPVDVLVFDDDGNETTSISCNEAMFNAKDSIFEFTGNVIVRTRDRTLRSEHLTWNEANQQFETTGFVTITTPADSIAGIGFVSDEDLLNYSLERVTGRFSFD